MNQLPFPQPYHPRVCPLTGSPPRCDRCWCSSGSTPGSLGFLCTTWGPRCVLISSESRNGWPYLNRYSIHWQVPTLSCATAKERQEETTIKNTIFFDRNTTTCALKHFESEKSNIAENVSAVTLLFDDVIQRHCLQQT